jgi:hypothetical protein
MIDAMINPVGGEIMDASFKNSLSALNSPKTRVITAAALLLLAAGGWATTGGSPQTTGADRPHGLQQSWADGSAGGRYRPGGLVVR